MAIDLDLEFLVFLIDTFYMLLTHQSFSLYAADYFQMGSILFLVAFSQRSCIWSNGQIANGQLHAHYF